MIQLHCTNAIGIAADQNSILDVDQTRKAADISHSGQMIEYKIISSDGTIETRDGGIDQALKLSSSYINIPVKALDRNVGKRLKMKEVCDQCCVETRYCHSNKIRHLQMGEKIAIILIRQIKGDGSVESRDKHVVHIIHFDRPGVDDSIKTFDGRVFKALIYLAKRVNLHRKTD